MATSDEGERPNSMPQPPPKIVIIEHIQSAGFELHARISNLAYIYTVKLAST